MNVRDFKRYNPYCIRLGDKVIVNIGYRYKARVIGLRLDRKNKKVFAVLAINERFRPTRVDVTDCYPANIHYPGHYNNG